MKEQEEISVKSMLQDPVDFMRDRGILLDKNDIKVVHDIDIMPYVIALRHMSPDAQTIFYVNFNKAMHSSGYMCDTTGTIQSENDLHSLLEVLCWIYFVQEYCVP